MELVKLEKINPKQQWKHEAYDFTPWLADNLQELGDVIGMDLELIGKEVPVGPFSADIVAKELSTNHRVIIENQLEKTNHDHLGKSLTYSSVLDAKTIVWIATKFTDEHKKAFEWLNDNTSTELSFFAIELSLLKISNEKASVVFDIVAGPNAVVKGANNSGKQRSETEVKQFLFWTAFRDAIVDDFKSLQQPRAQYWYDISLGKANIHISNYYSTTSQTIGCRIYIHWQIADKILPYLLERKEIIEKQLGFSLSWNPNPDNKDKIIVVNQSFNMEDKHEYDKAIAWLRNKTMAMHKVFSKIVKEYK